MFRLKSALLTDRRVKVMNEIICGIRVIKMYAWECAFEGVVSKLRKAECFIIFKTLAIRALQQTNITVSVTVLSFLIFSTYAATGGDIQPRSVFTILALLYILRTTIFYGFVSAVLDLSEANVAVTRIQVSKCLLLHYVIQDDTSCIQALFGSSALLSKLYPGLDNMTYPALRRFSVLVIRHC